VWFRCSLSKQTASGNNAHLVENLIRKETLLFASVTNSNLNYESACC
jgi:hypothetical protein